LQALLTLKQASPDKALDSFFARLKKDAPGISESLAELAKDFPLLSDAVIKFDRPVDMYEGEASGTVSLFLFDIRENLELRTNEPIIERKDGKATIQRPPKRVACTYLVTAWFAGSEKDRQLNEQKLLSQALQVLSRFPTIPNELLWGNLKDQQPPLPVSTMSTEGFKNPAEFWTALGGKLRPSFTVTVTISVSLSKPEKPVKMAAERTFEMKPMRKSATKQKGD
jgi:hypothetical protein